MKKEKEKPEIVVYDGYDVDEVMDLSDDFEDEEPIAVEEVAVRFERSKKEQQ